MKTRIKILFSLVAAFLLVNFVVKDATTPNELALKAQGWVDRAQYVAGLVDKKSLTNSTFEAVVKAAPATQAVKASEKRVVTYKGKQITIYTSSSTDELSPQSLEFFYNIQLEKERRGIK